jgi:uncharacterized iron-regulated membrane protein
MTQLTALRLRGWWLSIHKWIGILLAVLIIPLSVTGAALVWDGALDRALNPGRYEVTGTPALPASAYAEAARAALRPGESLLSLRFEEEGPVVATAARAADGEGAWGAPRAREGARREGRRGGPPVRTNVWIDPGSARVLDVASSNSGLVRVLHRLHGSFMIPGVGRQIVGWVGVAMLLSCLTGIWLWWPVGGNVRRGFRWKRRDSFSAKLHHQLGFWILLPLAMLSFTGAWISFPQFFGRFEAASAQRAGVTFRYTENGPQGLMTGKKAVVIESRGGLYSEGPAAAMDSQESHLRTMLGFIGITDVTFVRAERLSFGPDAVEAALNEAAETLDGFVRDELRLAA